MHRDSSFASRMVFAGIVLSQLLLPACQHARTRALAAEDSPPDKSPETVHRPVESIRLLKRNAGRAEWSPDGEYITYHTRGPDKFYDIHIMRADGTDSRCLNCRGEGFPDKHVGQPSWHPSGDWIVFQAQKENHIMPRVLGGLAAPGIGYHNDIWIMPADGKRAYRLTNLETKQGLLDASPTTGILQPHFSNDGKLLSWAEKVGDGGKWGSWVIQVADFKVDDDKTPSIANIRTYAPGANKLYYESNDFMPDTGKLLICGNLEPKQTAWGIDIYLLDLETRKTERLTHSMKAFDECPHPSPDGKRIAYLSTEGFTHPEDGGLFKEHWWNWVKGEFWLMDADGGNKNQITYFNTPGFPEYTGSRVIPAYVSWNNTGDKLVLGVAEEKSGELIDLLYLVELKK